MMEAFLTEFERALAARPARERADMVAAVRAHLEEAEEAGNLTAALAALGEPAAVAERMVAGGHRHRHLDAVTLPDGTIVWAASFRKDDYTRDRAPDFGLYLDSRWRPPWPYECIDWPDFGTPSDPAAMVTALSGVLRRARAGEVVELGCLGGHGRTGTALACLAALAGLTTDPVAWVRSAYCRHAVETDDQVALARSVHPSAGG